MVQPLKGWLPVCGRRVLLVGRSRCVFTSLVCVWMLSVLSVACRVCLVLLVCAARKGLPVLMGVMVLMVRRVLLGLLVRRVLRVVLVLMAVTGCLALTARMVFRVVLVLMAVMVCLVGMALMGLMVAVARKGRLVQPVHRVSVALLGLRGRRVLPVPMARMVGTARMVRMGAR